MKTTIKWTVILSLTLIAVACGKKNSSVSNAVTLSGDGRSSRSVDKFSGQKHHLISTFFLVNNAQKDKVGIYGQLRIMFPKPKGAQAAVKPAVQTMAATAPATTAAPAASKPGAIAPRPRPPTTPTPRTYYLFVEEYAACSDGPLGVQHVLVNHGMFTGTASVLNNTVTIPDVGVFTQIANGKDAKFNLAFSKNLGNGLKDFSDTDVKFNSWDSTVNLESLVTAHQNYPPVQNDAGQKAQIDDVKKKCETANKNTNFVDKIQPPDASEPVELESVEPQKEGRKLLGNDLEDKSQTPVTPPSPDIKDFKPENSEVDNA